MIERIRVAAIIIQGHNLLLVKGSDKYKEFWTPGGKLEAGESELECLKRELDEEINVKVVSAKFFGEYAEKAPYAENVLSISRVYIVSISGKIKTAKEIQGYVWMTRKEFEAEKYPLVAATGKKIIPDIIKAGYF